MILKQAKNIHFIGIGGIGASSLAQILRGKGKKISGSDISPSSITKSLKLSGIKVSIPHKKENINKKHDLVIYSPAIPETNPELKEAKKFKIKILSYPQALGELTKNYYTIAVAGTHGKSTTTAMISLIAEEGGLDPTVVIGTKVKKFKNKNFRIGESNYLIVEACEYKESFLNLDANIVVITNIEKEHLDYFKTLKNYKKAFEKLIKNLTNDGTLIINQNDRHAKSLIKNAKCQTIKLGNSKKANFILKGNSLSYYDKIETPEKNQKNTIKLKPKVAGIFNIENSAYAAITGKLLNIENKLIEKAIANFKGTWRRMQYRNKKGYNCRFIDDYAHHPTEIKMTLAAIREQNPNAKILCIFQPHQYSRTHKLLKQFSRSFFNADKTIIPNIYRVRDKEEDLKKISPQKLVNEIKKHHPNAKYGNGLKKTTEYIKKNHNKYDIVVTMGAGNIDDIYKKL